MTTVGDLNIGVPLLLAPTFDEKTWGGRRLEALGKTLPAGTIGESLESGSNARVVGGHFDGVTLGELARSHPSALLGTRGLAASRPFDDFPLLVKLIDANDDLSVQVHPDDAHAPPGKRGKTEAWYILDAEPGARIISGVSGAIEIARIQEQLIETVVSPGDVFLVPAGTVHAIGSGVLLYEIQQASDVTWRLFDWNRAREMHVEAALAVARPAWSALPVTPCRLDERRELLVACRYFALERWSIDGVSMLPARMDTVRIMTVLDGELDVGSLRVCRGATAILPADLPEQSLGGQGMFLLGYVPDLDADVRVPLLAAGITPEQIRGLGIETP